MCERLRVAACDEDTARKLLIAIEEAAHIVSLPAMDGDFDVLKLLERGVHINAMRGIETPCLPHSSVECLLPSVISSYRVNAAGTPPSIVSMQPVVFCDLDEAKKAMPSAMSRG